MKSRILLFVFSFLLMDLVGQIGFEERIVIDNTNTIDAPTDIAYADINGCLLYTSPSPRDATLSRMPSSA